MIYPVDRGTATGECDLVECAQPVMSSMYSADCYRRICDP
jgi:hypothetical protein